MVDKLFEMFKEKDPPPDSVYRFDTPGRPDALLGTPIEEVAEALNKRYLAELSRTLRAMAVGSDWNPADYVIICSEFLFHGWEAIDKVLVIHNPLCPDWSIFITKSPEAMMRDWMTDRPVWFGKDTPE
jgi:hypothetical protein